jgi:hypothetical protein
MTPDEVRDEFDAAATAAELALCGWCVTRSVEDVRPTTQRVSDD